MCFKYLHFQMPTFFLKVFWDAKIPPHCSFLYFLDSKGRQTWVAALVSLNGCLLFTFHLIFSSLSSTSRNRREREREKESENEKKRKFNRGSGGLTSLRNWWTNTRLINVVCRASRAAVSGCLLNQPRTPRSSHLDKRCLYEKPNKSKSHIQRLIYWPLTLRAKSSSTFMWILLNALFLVLL